MPLIHLPVDDVLPALIDALHHNSNVVLRAPAGAGKTTRVPPALLDSGLCPTGRILLLQPRRVAARAAARRIAQERGSQPGDEIGYQVRFDQQIGPRTRIAAVTEGILIRMLQDDPFLESVAAVLFDEFHERSLNADMALGMVRRVQQTVRPELKIVVMSATLAAEPIAAYLGGCPTVESRGRLHPVQIEYAAQFEKQPIHVRAAAAVESLLNRTPGDVLVFLPGLREIRQTAEHLAPLAGREQLALMQLYGDLPPEQQDAVLTPSDRRKVVLSTNVAETSLTIEGVTAVVDTGVARMLQFDPSVGLDHLRMMPISKAAADQRAGRAGRTQPGLCLRLWSEAAQRLRPDFEEPEIRRIDLAGAVLQLRAWGEADVRGFPWFESPRDETVDRAEQLLHRLEALDETGVTEMGHQMARLPVHPRLARLLMEGARYGIADRAALAAALLSERDPFSRSGSSGRDRPAAHRRPRHTSRSDLLDRVEALEAFERSGRHESPLGPLNAGAARQVLKVRDQLLRLMRHQAAWQRERPSEDAFLQALLSAYPDRLARRREPGGRRGLMVGGRGVRLADESALEETAELFVPVDVDGGQGEALVRQASAVERSWLSERHLRTATEVFFDDAAQRIAARRRVWWDDLLLEESPAALPSGEELSRLLAEAAAQHLERVFPADNADVAGYVARVQCLRDWMPDLGLPELGDEQLRGLLPMLCAGVRSFDEIRRGPWLHAMKSLLTPAQLQQVEREAPERLPVPSGNRISLKYERGRPPVLAVRIQELFGLHETPRIAGGRVRVLLHLLAPNMRPQQITDDLPSFWANGYPEVRKELRRRYPKHAWPEDPRSAPPRHR